jgi:hypothetical protein
MRAILFLLISSQAFAFSAGITGHSGASGTPTCTECHSGGTAPTVRLSGPTTMLPGETAPFTVDIVSGATAQKSGGLDLAASGGTLTAKTPGTAVSGSELIHKMVLTGTSIRVELDFTAPSSPGTVTLSVAGLSSNGSGTSGDGTGTDVHTISVESPVDFAGLDLLGVDLSEPPPDLAVVDAVTGATMRPPLVGDEPRWACDCRLAHGGEIPLPALLVALALLLRIRRRGASATPRCRS